MSHSLIHSLAVNARGGGYSHTLPIRVCVPQRGREFEAPGLGRPVSPSPRAFFAFISTERLFTFFSPLSRSLEQAINNAMFKWF